MPEPIDAGQARDKVGEAMGVSGRTVDDRLLLRAAEAGLEDCEFLADVRGSVAYKRELLRVYVRRTVRAAVNAGACP